MAKFCSKCGNALPEEDAPCPNCEVTEQPAAETMAPKKTISQMTIGEIGQSVKESAQSVKFDAASEDIASVTIGGNKVKISTIIKIIAIGLCILFFLPLFSVSCTGMKLSFNGLDATLGKTISMYGSKEKIDGNFLAIFLLLIPAALFSAFQFKQKISFVAGKLFKISTGLSVLGLIGFIILTFTVNNYAEQNLATASFTFWYYLSILLYLIAGAISIGCVLSGKKTEQQDSSIPPDDN